LKIILGISAFYHDSAAALIIGGQIIAAAQEERFTRVKNTSTFPVNAIKYCLNEANIDLSQVNAISFYEKPKLKLKRFVINHIINFPWSYRQFNEGIMNWQYSEKSTKNKIVNLLKPIGEFNLANQKILFTEHHLSHAASAYYCSDFNDSAILTIDGVGELATTSIFYAQKEKITKIKEIQFPHSLGLLYSSFTQFLGFKVNSGEYKLMGLASYGNPDAKETILFEQIILTNLIEIKADGSFKLNMSFFDFQKGFTMIQEAKWSKLFKMSKRLETENFEQIHCNLAFAIQKISEKIILRLAQESKRVTNSNNLCLAGGVALNCVANGQLLKAQIFDNLYIQPASGDAGGAIGAALAANHLYFGYEKKVNQSVDIMRGSFLGPSYNNTYIGHMNQINEFHSEYYSDFAKLCNRVAHLVNEGNIIGWFQGRMEFGPRALGNRSIIADPTASHMQKKLNIRIKKREGFRPFAPSVLEEDCADFFELDKNSPFMQYVAKVNEKNRFNLPAQFHNLTFSEKLYLKKSTIPAVTHVDLSARVQTVSKASNLKFWQLIQAIKSENGVGMVINTSFNVRGEPIVCSPEDAIACFINSDMDFLVIENHLYDKKENSRITFATKSFELD
jgi:carbamoyltransferase